VSPPKTKGKSTLRKKWNSSRRNINKYYKQADRYFQSL